jgi:hypothetical protein
MRPVYTGECMPALSQEARERLQHKMVSIEIEHAIIVCFRREAQRRDVPVTRLIHDLLDVIAHDRLVDAVLDDRGDLGG